MRIQLDSSDKHASDAPSKYEDDGEEAMALTLLVMQDKKSNKGAYD
jgi:hypothetical protein